MLPDKMFNPFNPQPTQNILYPGLPIYHVTKAATNIATRKGSNCDALQLEPPPRRRANRSGL